MPRHSRTASESKPSRRPQSYAEPAHLYAQRVNDFYATAAQPSIPHQDSGYDGFNSQSQLQAIENSTTASANRAGTSAWTPSDDRTLITSRTAGLNWSQIRENYFPNKSPNACRKRHERLMERKNTDEWDNRKMQHLAKEYMKLRKEIWEPLASSTGEKWSVVEQKCMSKGLKNIQSAARAASRRERYEQSDLHRNAGYDDDSGVSGIGLTPADEADQYSSPDDCVSVNQSFATVTTSGLTNYNPPQYHQQQQQQHQHQQNMAQLHPIDAHYAMQATYAHNGYPINHHRYSSSGSSSASISHPFVSKGGRGSSPYLDDHRLV